MYGIPLASNPVAAPYAAAFDGTPHIHHELVEASSLKHA